MKHLKMIDWAPEPKEENKIIWNSAWARAHHAGLFQSAINCGELVHKNQIVGTITDPFGEFKEQVKSPSTGYVVGLNNHPVVNAGDALLTLVWITSAKLMEAGKIKLDPDAVTLKLIEQVLKIQINFH